MTQGRQFLRNRGTGVANASSRSRHHSRSFWTVPHDVLGYGIHFVRYLFPAKWDTEIFMDTSENKEVTYFLFTVNSGLTLRLPSNIMI